MKAFFFFLFVVSTFMHPAAAAVESPARPCVRVLHDLDDLARQIGLQSDGYWARRSRYIELKRIGRFAAPGTKAEANRQKVEASSSRAIMPQLLASFRGAASEAQAQRCLSAEQLLAVRERTIKLARKVNFDRFPEDESGQTEDDDAASVGPSMPK